MGDSDLVASVLGEVDDQLHIATFSNRLAFWEKLKVSDLLPNLCTSLKDMYVVPSASNYRPGQGCQRLAERSCTILFSTLIK